MAKIPDLVYYKVRQFLKLLEENDYKIERAYIFGSYAKGKADEWSDIDLALISDKFEGDRFSDTIALTEFVFQSGGSISPLPFRSEDFENSLFARDEILKKGILVED